MKHQMKVIVASLCVVVSLSLQADNLLTDTCISMKSGWSCWASKFVLDAGGSVILQDGKAVAKSPAIEKQRNANIQLIKAINVEPGKSYRLKFKGNTTAAGTVTVTYNLLKAPYTAYASTRIDMKAGEKEYECTLTVKEKDENSDIPYVLRLYLGAFENATVTISDVSFECAE